MPKTLTRSNLMLALALTATIGCTTNYNRGDGEPATGSPGAGPTAPTAGNTSGSSSGTTLPQPMTSSSRLTNSPEEALAIMQRTQTGVNGKVLGPVNPANTGEARVGGYTTGQEFDGRIRQLTVNSSIANPYGPQAAVTSGAGDADATFFSTNVAGATATGAINTGAVTSGGTATSGAATAGTSAAVIAPSTTAATPTSASLPLTAGTFAAGTGTLTPSVSSSVVATPTTATSPIAIPATGMISSSAVGATNATTGAATTGTGGRQGTAAIRLNRSGLGSQPTATGLTVTQTATGRITISNVK